MCGTGRMKRRGFQGGLQVERNMYVFSVMYQSNVTGRSSVWNKVEWNREAFSVG